MSNQITVKTFKPDDFGEKLARKLFGVNKPDMIELKQRAINWAISEYTKLQDENEKLKARITELEAAPLAPALLPCPFCWRRV